MINGKGSRLLPVLAAVLILAALFVSIALIILRVPPVQKFDDALTSARMALRDGRDIHFKSQLLKASRHAVSVDNWQRILKTALEEIPADASGTDYKLFTVLAGRAAAAIPGASQFPAYWIWGLLRIGDTEKAAGYTDLIENEEWSSLNVEVNLRAAVGDSDDDLSTFISKLKTNSDPEFLSMAANLTRSAELTFDTALLYMLNGNAPRAFNLAEELVSHDLWWSDEENISRYSVFLALSLIAYDEGSDEKAIRWLETGLKDTDRRRTTSWETLQFLGDLYWDRYLLQGMKEDLVKAGEAWMAAIRIIIPISSDETGNDAAVLNPVDLPTSSWSLWVNLAVQQAASGNVRESRKTLTSALSLFPDIDEVKAAWARAELENDPALARRLIRNSGISSPVLGITQIDIDPESVTPRLYEARLWELFNDVTSGEAVQDADRRILATFLLNYMSSRRNFSSVDVAIDRYLKVYPDENWILSWRLASDASRGIALFNLLPDSIDGSSPYEKFRNLARDKKSWRALHDSALFAIMASDEIKDDLKRNLRTELELTASEDQRIILDASIFNILKSYRNLPRFRDTPLEDRVQKLENKRSDLLKSSFYRNLESSGRKGEETRALATSVLLDKSSELLENALNDLSEIDISVSDLSDDQRSDLLYMEALLLNKIGRREESLVIAREVLLIIPEHAGARELLNEVRY